MPRPSKHVSPDTLGGRIRAAREHLHRSLAEVANGHYSTSLISQIERNRVDPSQESLRFLAEQLDLSLDELEVLAQQHRESEIEAREYTSYDALRSEAALNLADGNSSGALRLLEKLHFTQVPSLQRWRLAALRGQCYFAQRKFVKAQEDFVYATKEEPKQEGLPPDQKQELMLLHLHLAGTYRELNQLEEACEQFQITLRMMNRETPFGYVAEAHWLMSLITFAQASRMQQEAEDTEQARQVKLRVALEHAEYARSLYSSIGEHLRAASVSCHAAQIELQLGRRNDAQHHLQHILDTWHDVSLEPEPSNRESRLQKERENVISIASCLLAEIALEDKQYDQALEYAALAVQSGERSYIVRQAEAYTIRGRILDAMQNPDAEADFRRATEVLAPTERIGARISAHVRLGSYLLKIGKTQEGEKELEKTRILSDSMLTRGVSTSTEDVLV